VLFGAYLGVQDGKITYMGKTAPKEQPATIVDNGNAAQPGVLVEPWSITSVRMTLK
jgi:hypothetical protein